MNEVFSEYVGLTAEAISLIEGMRADPRESKSQILIRTLSSLQKLEDNKETKQASFRSDINGFIDYGEGIRIRIGEPLFLFLSVRDKNPYKADARGEVHQDGFYLDGRNIGPSNKRQFTPAMHIIQEKKNHRNPAGKLVPLSAMRQWHVVRDGELRSLVDIKDPKLARKRGGEREWKGINLDDLKFEL
jgi:hypothetical protein